MRLIAIILGGGGGNFDRLCQNIKLINLVSPFINMNRYMPAGTDSFNTIKFSFAFHIKTGHFICNVLPKILN